MNIFEESLSILSNKTKIRKLVAELHSDDIQRIIDRLGAVQLEILEAEETRQAELAQKKDALDEIKSKLQELGLSVDDLGDIASESKPKQKRNYKQREKFTFNYETEHGEHKQWHGATVGRKPDEFAKFLDRTGKKAEDCIVQN